MVEYRTTGVGRKVTGSIRHTLNLHVVWIEAVHTCIEVILIGSTLALCSGLCARLTEVFVAHLMVDVEVRLHLPLNIRWNVSREGRLINKCDAVAAVLGILASLLQEERRGFDLTFCGSTYISTSIVRLHSIGDVEVSLVFVVLS